MVQAVQAQIPRPLIPDNHPFKFPTARQIEGPSFAEQIHEHFTNDRRTRYRPGHPGR
jgi:hypothetical protein